MPALRCIRMRHQQKIAGVLGAELPGMKYAPPLMKTESPPMASEVRTSPARPSNTE